MEISSAFTHIIALLNVINIDRFIDRVQQLLHVLLSLATDCNQRLQGLIVHVLQQLDDHLIEEHFVVREPLNRFHQETVQTQLVPDFHLPLAEEHRMLRADQLTLGPVHRVQHVFVEKVLLDELTKHFTDLGHIPIAGQELRQQLVPMKVTDSVDIPKYSALLSAQCIREGLLELRVPKCHLVVLHSLVQSSYISLLAVEQLIHNVP